MQDPAKMFFESLSAHKNLILLFSTLAIFITSTLLLALFRLAQILPTPQPLSTTTSASELQPLDQTQKNRLSTSTDVASTHLLVVLGSGGHTAEMLNILSTTLPNLPQTFTRRTYLISSGDSFSAQKAVEFEKSLEAPISQLLSSASTISPPPPPSPANSTSTPIPRYTIATVHRARKVHQSWLSTPLTTLLSLWDCMAVLRGTHRDLVTTDSNFPHLYPDLILTNGPGTGVCVVVAALILRFFGLSGSQQTHSTTSSTSSSAAQIIGQQQHEGQHRGQMRSIFIESWARVKTLSLSGRILRPLVNRFLVQWPQLAEAIEKEDQMGGGLGVGVNARVEYVEPLVS